MRLFFSKHELKLRRKRTIAAIICVVLVLGVYYINRCFIFIFMINV